MSGTIPGSLGPRNGIEMFVLLLVRGCGCSPFFFELCGDVEGGKEGRREGGQAEGIEGGRKGGIEEAKEEGREGNGEK